MTATATLESPASPVPPPLPARIPHGVLTSFYDEIVAEGYLARVDDRLELSDSGRRAVAAIGDGWTNWLLENLKWTGDTVALDERVRMAVRGIARRVMLEQQQQLVHDQAPVQQTPV